MRRTTSNRIDSAGASRRGHGWLRPVVALLVGAGAIATAAACEPVLIESPAPSPARAGALRVDVVGDSLVRQSTPDLERALQGAGFGYTIISQPSMDLTTDFVQSNLARVAAGPADVVVLATASNDVQWEALGTRVYGPVAAQRAYRENLANAIASLGGRCVVVVNSRENVGPLYSPAQAPILNANLRAEVSGRSNVVLVDWAATSRSHGDDWFIDDGLHFGHDAFSATATRAGAPAYAAAITAGVRACEAKLRPATPGTPGTTAPPVLPAPTVDPA